MFIYVYIHLLNFPYIYIHMFYMYIYIERDLTYTCFTHIYLYIYILHIFPAHAEQLGVSTGPRLSMPGQLPQGPPKALCDLQELTTLMPLTRKNVSFPSRNSTWGRNTWIDQGRRTAVSLPSKRSLSFPGHLVPLVVRAASQSKFTQQCNMFCNDKHVRHLPTKHPPTSPKASKLIMDPSSPMTCI